MRGLSYSEARKARRIAAISLAAVTLIVICFCSWGGSKSAVAETASAATPNSQTLSILSATDNPYLAHLDSMPDDGGIKLRYRPVGAGSVFNDSNYLHIEAAEAVGIDPIVDLKDAWRLKRPLVRIETCAEYFVDSLTHSEPYLVPEAANLLAEIGRSFVDSLQARGGGDYRIKVTSVLRTPESVKKLVRRNRNAVETSAHQYGTTFDISYNKFICQSDKVVRTSNDLKGLLAEILDDLHSQGRCYVKHERKQSCFHITVRPKS